MVGVAVIARVKSSKRVPVMRPGHRVNSCMGGGGGGLEGREGEGEGKHLVTWYVHSHQ